MLENPDEFFTEYKSEENTKNTSLFWLASQIYRPLSWVLLEAARLVDGYEDQESKRRQVVVDFEAHTAIKQSADRYPPGYQRVIEHLSDKSLVCLFKTIKENQKLASLILEELPKYQLNKDKRNKMIWVSTKDERTFPFAQDKPAVARVINGNVKIKDVAQRIPLSYQDGSAAVEYRIIRLALEQPIDSQETKEYHQYLRENKEKPEVKNGAGALLPKYAELLQVAGSNCPSLEFLIEISGAMGPEKYDHLKNPSLAPFDEDQLEGEGSLFIKIQAENLRCSDLAQISRELYKSMKERSPIHLARFSAESSRHLRFAFDRLDGWLAYLFSLLSKE